MFAFLRIHGYISFKPEKPSPERTYAYIGVVSVCLIVRGDKFDNDDIFWYKDNSNWMWIAKKDRTIYCIAFHINAKIWCTIEKNVHNIRLKAL